MNYFIVTFTKVHHQISEEQRNKILGAEFTRMNMPDGSMVTNNNIADILPEDKYYQTYPDRRPEEVRDTFKEVYGMFNEQVRKPTERAKELMKQGFYKARKEVFDETDELIRQKFKDFHLTKIGKIF